MARSTWSFNQVTTLSYDQVLTNFVNFKTNNSIIFKFKLVKFSRKSTCNALQKKWTPSRIEILEQLYTVEHITATQGTCQKWPLCAGDRYTEVTVKQVPLYM